MNPFLRECYIMAKPAGAKCNLRCSYCYYLEKQHLYKSPDEGLMSDALLEEFTRQYIEMQTTGHALFTWHGGEATLRPISFYRKAMSLQQKYANGRHIENCLQTNGILITPEWCRFLHDNNWLVGLSIDGPQDLHDAYRKDQQCSGTWHKVIQVIEMMNKYDVQWNAMAAINDRNVKQPDRFYSFFKDIGCRYIQFTPIVERISAHQDGRSLATPDEKQLEVAPFSVKAREWGEFLCAVFDKWVKTDVGEIFVQLFDATLANWVGEPPGICTMARECGHAGVIEANGDLYSCDHFVFPQFRLGNIREHSLIEMMYGQAQSRFASRKHILLPQECHSCRWLFACNGECPRNRFVYKNHDPHPINYLCQGYKMFFDHAAPKMDIMASLYKSGLPPSDIMRM